LSAQARAHKLLERIDQKLLEADAPPQRKALFTCPPEEKLKTARKMINYFENEENNQRVWRLKIAGTELLEVKEPRLTMSFQARAGDCRHHTLRLGQNSLSDRIVLQASCDAVPSFEQAVESWQRFAATMLLKFTNPRLNRCGPSI
jgi:hypothetical protein